MTTEESKLIELKRAKAARYAYESYRYYEPIGKVEQFIDLVGSGEYICVLLSAANGVGKTYAGANILANLIWNSDNPYFDQPLFRKWDFPKKVRIISEPNTIIETIIPMLKEVFPKGRYGVEKYEVTKEGKRYESKWITDTGWTLNLMTYEQDVKEFESATLGLVWMDEPPPQSIYTANISRLRQGGVAFITATLLSGAWMYDKFIADPKAKKNFLAGVQAEVEDACLIHGKRGFLEHDQIVKMISQYDKDELEARAFGKPLHLTGLIFKMFRNDIHVIPRFTIPSRDYIVVHALDTHPRTPDAGSWIAIDRQGTKIIVDELWSDAPTKVLAEEIKKRNEKYRVTRMIIEPAAFIASKHDKEQKSLARRLQEYGLTYLEASKARTAGIRLTKDELTFIGQPGAIASPPGLYVFEDCTHHIYEFTHWSWDNWRGKTAENRDPKNKPEDKGDHFMENVGRILLQDEPFIEEPRTPVRLRPSRNASSDPYD